MDKTPSPGAYPLRAAAKARPTTHGTDGGPHLADTIGRVQMVEAGLEFAYRSGCNASRSSLKPYCSPLQSVYR